MPYIKGVLAGALLALAVAAPAIAHEGNPNYSSEVSAIAPALPGLEARVLNHDDRIELVWTGAGTLVVEGYRGEPYLRFGPDGRVEVNRRSPAAYLNEDRFAQVEVPGRADHHAEPEWQTVASGGRYDWHDHRIHWMNEDTLPPQVEDEGQRTKVFDWRLPLAAGATSVAVRGKLTWLGTDDSGFPLAAAISLLAAAGAGMAVVLFVRRRRRAARHAPGEGRGLVRAPLLALGLLLLAPGSAAAHAELVAATPARGAQLEAAPERVTLRFNEPVEASFGALRVFGADGERVDEGEAERPGGDSDALAIGLRDDLPDGSYTATYRVVSADSHPVTGGFVFTVGRGGGAPAASVAELIDAGEAGPVTDTAFGAVRALGYLAIALAVGGLAFLALVWLPGLRAAGGAEPAWALASEAFAARFGALAAVAVGLGVLTSLLGIALQGANAAGIGLWAALDPDVLSDVLATRFGTVWGLKLLAWLLLGAALTAALTRDRIPVLRPASLGATGLAAGPRAAPLALALLALPLGFLVLSPALSGHAGSTDPVALLVLSDAVHVLAMSVWIGGLACLVVVLPVATRRLEPAARTRLLAACVSRFSPLALGAVIVLLASGLLQSIVHLESLGDLTGSAFGRAILVKGALMALLIALGAVNLRRNRPELVRLAARGERPGDAGRLLRRAVRAELVLLMAVLGVTAALTSSPPPGAAAEGPFSTSSELGPARLEVTVDPAASGVNEIHLYLFERRSGRQYDRLGELRVTLTLPDKDIGPLEPRLDKAGPGHYVARRAQIAPAGDWELDVAARPSDFREYRTELEVPVE